MLAEYGLCCAGEGGEGEEGLFLKFAIKHLLALNMKLKSNISSSNKEMTEYDKQLSHNSHVKESQELKSDTLDVEMVCTETHETIDVKKDNFEEIASNGMSSHSNLEKGNAQVDSEKCCDDNDTKKGEKNSNELTECGNELAEDEREELELIIDNALDQCFYCLYGLNLRSDSSYEDDLVMHRNTSRGDYQTKEQSADVFQYVLPYARASSVSIFMLSLVHFLSQFCFLHLCAYCMHVSQRTGLVKLRRVLRAIRKHFPQPPEDVLAGNAIDKFLDDPDLCEDKLSEEAGSDGYLETIMKIIFPDMECIKQFKAPSFGRY